MARVDEKDFKVMGKSLPRKEGLPMVTGRFKHVGDYTVPGMLWGTYLCSPYAHAEIVSVDTSAAKALPGVRTVITFGDVGRIAMSKVASQNMFPLTDKARAVGDAIAAVAADTIEIAEEALDLIKVNYKVLPHITDILESSKPGAPEIHAKGNGQSIQPGNYRERTDQAVYGDREAGIKASDKIFEFTNYSSQTMSNRNSERRSALAFWPDEDKLTLYVTCQGVFEERNNQAKDLKSIIKIPWSGIRVLCECSGGGFGSNKFGRHGYIATLLSYFSGKRPVRVEHSRRLELGFEAHGRSPVFTNSLKIGIKNNGDLTHCDWSHINGHGCYSQDNTRKMGKAPRTHKMAAAWEKSDCVYTNTMKAGWKRTVSGALEFWPFGSGIDQIAESLGKPPWEYLYQTMTEKTNPANNLPWISNEMRLCLDRVMAASDMKNKWKGWKTPVSTNGPIKRGIGVSIAQESSGNTTGGAMARLMEDGTFRLELGTTNTGQGQPTTQAQVFAEAVGATYGMVSPRVGDTDFPENSRSNASNIATSTSRATKLVGEMLKKIILDNWVAPLFKVNPGELDMEEGVIWVKADPTKKMTLAEATSKLYLGTTGYAYFPIIAASASTKAIPGVAGAAFGTYVAEVDVDTDTGLVKVVGQWNGQDTGRTINPLVCIAQTESGLCESQDMALQEERIWDPQTGVCLTTDWLTYPITTFVDIPETGKVFVLDKPDDPNCPPGPYGAKGFSQDVCEGHIAIGNAVYNAVGVRIKELPMTPDRILKALGKG